MKKRSYFLIIFFGIISCNSNNETSASKYQFIKPYVATVTVGGIVGIIERSFEIGEIYIATKQGQSTITIRIAEHTALNDDCPNSQCYQELLEVPSEFLKLIE